MIINFFRHTIEALIIRYVLVMLLQLMKRSLRFFDGQAWESRTTNSSWSFCDFHFLPLKLPHFFWGFLPTFLQYPQQSELDPQGDPGPLQGSAPLVTINMIKKSDNSLKICLVKFMFWIIRAIISVNGLFYTIWSFWGS